MTSAGISEARCAALLARDAREDGQWLYAVRTTGVYCRPSCPSRQPRREHVRTFESEADATAAGFRACRRCRPGEVQAGRVAVARALTLLDGAAAPPSLTALAAEAGLSRAHFQRLFTRVVGVSPKQYVMRQRTERLKAALQGGASVTDAMWEAGHQHARTVYDPVTAQLGMTPGQYRAGGEGVRVAFTVVESVVGPLLVAATVRGVCAVRLGEPDALLQELRVEFSKAEVVRDDAALAPLVPGVLAFLRGGSSVPLDVAGTAFQRRVWVALAEIPYGETRSYAQVAAMIGAPEAVRAVAGACARNPVALVVPCHRVVRAGGALSGYRWGVARKAALLAGEREGRWATVECGSGVAAR